MLHRDLLLLLRVLTMTHFTMLIDLLICIILRLFLLSICILLISILGLHNIIIIYMLVLVKSLLLSAVVGIVNFVSYFRIVISGWVCIGFHLIWTLYHIYPILMITANMMTLKMILLFQNVNILICCHYVRVWHWVIKVFFVITCILLSRLKNILHLSLQLLLLLNLFLLCNFFLSLFSLSHTLFHLSFVFVFYWLVDDVSFLFQVSHSSN